MDAPCCPTPRLTGERGEEVTLPSTRTLLACLVVLGLALIVLTVVGLASGSLEVAR